MIPQGADTDSVMLDETKHYTEGLMQAWSKLLGDVGAGTHTFDLRISPRGVIDPKPGPDPDGGYNSPGRVCH